MTDPANAAGSVRAPFICVGDIMVDVLARLSGELVTGSDRAAPIRWLGGGSAANTAAWLAAQGVAVTLIGRIGDDALGAQAARELREAGVALAVGIDFERPTGCCIVLVSPDGERTMVPDTGANAALSDDAPDQLLAAAGHLHLSGYPLFGAGRTGALGLLGRARRHGLTVSVDAASAGPLRTVGPQQFLEWIGSDILLFANHDEAAVLSGSADPVTAARHLAHRTGRCIVKLGAGGALWSDGTTTVTAPGQSVEVVDTTGAGDAFAAGVLTAASAGADWAGALTAGISLATLACRTLGGRPASPPPR